MPSKTGCATMEMLRGLYMVITSGTNIVKTLQTFSGECDPIPTRSITIWAMTCADSPWNVSPAAFQSFGNYRARAALVFGSLGT